VPQSRNNKLIITGKLFEYLASGRPVLSVGPLEGDASAILKDTGRKNMVEYDDRNSFKTQLKELYEAWKKEDANLPGLDTGMLEQYSRKASAKLIAEYMKEALS